MKHQLSCICILILFFTFNGFAQVKTQWLVNLENTIKQKEPLWKIQEESQDSGNSSLVYSLILKSDENSLAIKIAKFNDSATAKKQLTDLISFTKKVSNKQATEIKLKDTGDEGYTWKSKSDNWAKIMLRKKNFLIDIVASSEISGKRFAKHVLEQIPKN